MIAATHLSCYCACLSGGVLPRAASADDDAWSKDLYKYVKKAADHALTG
jgi:hypothetical protein